MICIYHNKDLDGFCSGAIVKRRFPEAVMIGYDYGEPFDLEHLSKGEPVIMVDVSMPMIMMWEIARRSEYQLTWIDHHKSAIEDYKTVAENLTIMVPVSEELQKKSGVYVDSLTIEMLTPIHRVGVGACELAWEFFFPNEEMPLTVQLLGKYDTWRGNGTDDWNRQIYPFQMGMRAECNSLESFPMRLIEQHHDNALRIAHCIADGDLIIRYQKQYAELLCRSGAFECVFENLNAICLNAGGLNSEAMNSVFEPIKHDVIIYFFWQKTFWKFSVYTKDPLIDVSVIAKKYGGGGHRQAAGFECNSWHIDKGELIITGFEK